MEQRYEILLTNSVLFLNNKYFLTNKVIIRFYMEYFRDFFTSRNEDNMKNQILNRTRVGQGRVE